MPTSRLAEIIVYMMNKYEHVWQVGLGELYSEVEEQVWTCQGWQGLGSSFRGSQGPVKRRVGAGAEALYRDWSWNLGPPRWAEWLPDTTEKITFQQLR